MMKHYQEKDWRAYRLGLLPEEEELLLEEHLERCDQCLENFLALITEKEISQAKRRISPNFTDSVLNLLREEENSKFKGKNSSSYQRKNIFIYYLAVSAITIILMGSGFFQALVDKLPSVETDFSRQEERYVDSFEWTRKVTDKAANWLYNFETKS